MNKIINKLLFSAALFSILITSCGIDPSISDQKPRSDWLAKWLSSPTCQPPCWENIVPGKNSIDDANLILSTMEEVKIISYSFKDPLSESKQSDWRFNRSDDSGVAQTDEQGNVISLNSFNINESLTVGEVISKYGFPTSVLLYDCRSEMGRKGCVTHLVYKNKGMALDLFLNDYGNNNYQIKILPDSKLYRIWFFPDVDDAYEKLIGKNSPGFPKYFFQWVGYSNYP